MKDIRNYHKRYDIIRLDTAADAKKWAKDGGRFCPWPFTHASSGRGSFADYSNGISGYGDYRSGNTYENYAPRAYTIYVAAAEGWKDEPLPEGLTYSKGHTASTSGYCHDGIGTVNAFSTSLMAFRVDSSGRLCNTWLRTTGGYEGLTPDSDWLPFTKRAASRILGMAFGDACPPRPDPEALPEAALGAVRRELAAAKAAGKRPSEWFGRALGGGGKWRALDLRMTKSGAARHLSAGDFPIGMKYDGACFVSDACELVPAMFRRILGPFVETGGKMLAPVRLLDGYCALVDEEGVPAIRGIREMKLSYIKAEDLRKLGWVLVGVSLPGDGSPNRWAFADTDGYIIGDWLLNICMNPFARDVDPQLTPDGNIICQKLSPDGNAKLHNILSKDGSYLLDEWMSGVAWLSGGREYSAKYPGWMYRWCVCRTVRDEVGVYDARERGWLLKPSANIDKAGCAAAEPVSGHDPSANITFTDKAGIWHCLDADGVVYEYYGGKVESGWS